jgi:uncharacterized protein (DUF433 family)
MGREYVERREDNYYISGGRISMDSIIHAFRLGASPETIRQDFELLHLEEVYGAITFYLANQIALDRYLKSQHEEWAESKRSADLNKAILAGPLRREPAIDFLSAQAAGLRGIADIEVLALAATM